MVIIVFMLKCIKIMLFYFLKIILKSAHQNNPKHIKKLIFYETQFAPRS